MEIRNLELISASVFFYLIVLFSTKIYLKENGYDVAFLRTRIRDLNLLFEVTKKYKNGFIRKMHFVLYLFIIIFPVVVIVIFITSQPSGNYLRCNLLDDFREKQYSGVILDKYIDEKNHAYETVILLNGDKEFSIKDFIYFEREYFDAIQIGDSLFKKEGNEYILIKRDSLNQKLYLNVDCDYQKYEKEKDKYK